MIHFESDRTADGRTYGEVVAGITDPVVAELADHLVLRGTAMQNSMALHRLWSDIDAVQSVLSVEMLRDLLAKRYPEAASFEIVWDAEGFLLPVAWLDPIGVSHPIPEIRSLPSARDDQLLWLAMCAGQAAHMERFPEHPVLFPSLSQPAHYLLDASYTAQKALDHD